ncbi:transcriptional regulator [Reichenbachiella sp. 5M10]|uniref:GbsR/MarR family transcriptional regulator n=1 Tax=Reichenbachiella sp. 5M10 TaxID=1889772 RepID=UPI000C157457|nr:ArsR family transcriptional regulator [Reichenbachiella sp. 5M10]PIB35269.1 transcriptional regulator [Reichenbachiella sp. 5M10]
MDYKEARDKYIQAWGTLGSSWGINRAMAQIHALLLVSTASLSAEEMMSELQMSRGNVNMNLRALMDWGIVEKEHKAGERKEFFYANKDVWELARQVSKERRRREIEPILKVLNQVQSVSGDSKEIREFKKVTRELNDFSLKVDGVLDKFTKSDQNWFVKLLMKL